MRKLISLLVLLSMAVIPVCSGQTFNTWERGYITVASCTSVAALDVVSMCAPVVDGDTINVRGIMLGFQSVIAHGHGHNLHIRYREPGADGWERWDQWVKADSSNWGLPLPGKWQGLLGTNSMGCTPFIPLANVRELHLYNSNASAAMHVLVLWFVDEADAKAADWSTWEAQ